MVEVITVPPTLHIDDRRYVTVVYDDHAMIVDADKGSTRIVPLEAEWDDDEQRASALLQSATQLAEAEGAPVVYLIDYSQVKPGDPVMLPE